MRFYYLLVINIIALIASSIMLSSIFISRGLSATALMMLLIVVALSGHLLVLFKRQHQQSQQVILALANGDSTLGLARHHPMRQQFEQVKLQMQQARFDAEQQAQFLQALLIHIDLAVLVCDEQGHIIESNPAVSRLLGLKFTTDDGHLSQLGGIGNVLQKAQTNMRTTLQWQVGEQQDTLSIQLTIAQIQGQTRRIVSLQSIHDQLVHKEQQAYKRLTKVLTHEIANSITPLSSLAATCEGLLPDELCFDEQEDKEDLQLALTTLASRTQHLSDFIARFRQVSSLPKPTLKPHDLTESLESTLALHQQQAKEQGIKLTLKLECQQLVMIDSAQIEQVLINLVKNSIEALAIQSQQCESEEPEVTIILAKNSKQQLYVEVSDNGMGVAAHVVEMIFVPFFTTKQQGSGIGLSLSKQIMVSHGGDLIYLKRESGACFRCLFG
ncbi:PAS domain-containing sensor histidine kinase [Psychrobium sp. 1_MG-2023]|uniref:sensor histidine kinase n=1 Tax=Psychrobium sp. 1_MG-2023 TaxID=3062624 RepID=UPI000C328B7B|nr:ATP-binding protein [Psychrobium sp. 1_MG-2023]MDP2561629.1 ATP-binding protein [Psychrobium sp. 1_MG-2023]PKF55647.1 histidine kinase [Alteromonadales bacterium alter-6D02]